MSHVYVSTFRYFASHAKSPRGRGMWAFSIGAERHPLSTVLWLNASYSEAKAAAIAAASLRDITTVEVLP